MACGMHDYGFSPFGAQTSPLPQLPAGTRLVVPSFLSVGADTAAALNIELNAPAGFDNPVLSIQGPENAGLTSDGDQPVAEGQSLVRLPFVARAGYHRVTVRLIGSVNGETRSLTRHAYVVAKPAEEVASR